MDDFMATTAADRAIERVRAEMERRKLNQTDLGDLIGWKQSKLSKVLNRKIELQLDDLAELCFGVGISLVEAVRDHGLEFCADMSPIELRALERLREVPASLRDAVLTILGVFSRPPEARGATKPKPALPPLRHKRDT